MGFLDMLLGGRPESRDNAYSLGQYLTDLSSFAFGGQLFPLGGAVQTTYGRNPAESIGDNFTGLLQAGMQSCPPVASVEGFRLRVLSEARFVFQRVQNGRPGDVFTAADLGLLETPWPGGTTGDLIAKLILHADFAGNAFVFRDVTELLVLRPDWVDIVLEKRPVRVGGVVRQVGWRKIGYAYWEGGRSSGTEPVVFLPDEVAHFAPLPDGGSTYRGMSWLTPVIREMQADGQATRHKQAFLENAATPNLAVSLDKALSVEQFKAFKTEMDKKHAGPSKAGRTLYLGGGADVTVIGKDMKELDFSGLVGKGETRIANAAGIHPVVLGFSESLQGSSLNAGNYSAGKRMTVDGALRPTWRNMAGSLQLLFPAPVPPPGEGRTPARLWYDARDVAFLRDDEQDVAAIQTAEAATIRQLLDAGFTPASATAAVLANDWKLLVHSGLYSVQLQPAGAQQTPPAVAGA
jgi:hypothetical protein